MVKTFKSNDFFICFWKECKKKRKGKGKGKGTGVYYITGFIILMAIRLAKTRFDSIGR